MTRAGMLRARRRWVKGRDIRRRSGELEALESGMTDASSRLGTHAGEKGKPSPVNWGEERLTGGGFVSQWGFLYLAALANPQHARPLNRWVLGGPGPLFKLTTPALTTP